MKKIILLILSILLLSGCTDYVEINELAIVTGILVDYKDDMYELTSQVIIIDKKSKIEVYVTKGITLDNALLQLSKIINKKIYITHLKILVITENIIKNKANYIDFFLRDSKSRMNFYVYFADDKDSKEVMNIYDDTDGSALYLDRMMIFNRKIFSSSKELEFIDLAHDSLEYGINVVYPVITTKENNEKERLYLDGFVSFNNKLEKLKLSEEDSIFYNIITNNTLRTLISVKCDDKLFTVDAKDASTKFKWKDNTFYIDTHIVGKVDNYECKYSLEDKKTNEILNKLFVDHLKAGVESVINLMKENNNDFLGVGNYIYKHDKDFVKGKVWDDEIKNIKIKVSIDAAVISTGEMKK